MIRSKPGMTLSSALAVLLLAAATAHAQPPQSGQAGSTQGGQVQTGQGGQRGRGGQQRPRDAVRDARDANRTAPAGTGVISGRVLAADTGQPVKRARIILTGGGRPFSAVTDDQGRYRIATLPAATYTITATKAGFVDAAFGQRRALRAGTPIELADGQQLANVDLKLPRGGVITGLVADEDGGPLPRAIVSVMRYQYIRGERQLMPAGVDQTDDRGQYRVFGLPPGDYYVSATTGGGLEGIIRSVLDAKAPAAATGNESTGYAPTYYPGVTTASSATQLKLAAGQELAGIDFQVQLVPLATVRGIVSGGNATVMLLPEGTGGGGGRAGLGGRGGAGRGGPGALAELAGGVLRGAQTFRAAAQTDGTFAIRNVPPGNYTIVARADAASGAPKMAVQTLTVAGDEVMVSLAPAPGVTLTGTITLEASGGSVPQGFSGFRITPQPTGPTAAVPRTMAIGTPDDRSQFSIANLMPGQYLLRATGPRGWRMKTIYANGRDVTDEAIEIGGQNISGINVIFTDRTTNVNGTVRDARGMPAVNVTVVVFSADEKHWHAQSRHIDAARTAANGGYRIAGLPPGNYLVAVTDDAEQGEWFDPAFLEQLKSGAARLTLGEGEQRSLDLKMPS